MRIERADEKAGSATIEINAHDPETGLPRHITTTSLTADKKSRLQAWFVIETIEPLADAPDSLFVIDPAGVQTIWDSDTDTFLKTRGWNRPVSMKELVDLCRARKAGR